MMQVGITDLGKNGFVNMLMQNEQDAKKVIKTCEHLIEAGVTSDTIINCACDFCNVSFDSFMSSEKEKIKRKVEEIYKTKNNAENRKG